MKTTERSCDELGCCQLAEYGECKGPCMLADSGAKEMPIQFVGPEPEDVPPVSAEGVMRTIGLLLVALLAGSLSVGLVAGIVYGVIQRGA